MSTAQRLQERVPAELLNDAFNVFREASRKLEQQYALLERRVEELNEELAEKNRVMERTRRLAAMGEMAAKIAHEIRNPLGSMAIFATLLERELANDAEKRKFASYITNGINTLDNLLSNMLLFASAPAARLKSVDIREVIEDSILLVSGYERAGGTVTSEFEGHSIIMADGSLLRQLFLNLLINAMDSLDGGAGTVGVSAKVIEEGRGPMLVVQVRDTGKGIPAEELDRIFDPFFSTKERGTGLGLAIVSAVVNAHRGSIDVDSKKGEGTVFTIRIPAE
ncbi:MAG: hypothetical protein HZB84_09825 [Deltaproteobacteria bacterium]|nr:hypothetical protein [Deltaproteobacteria bacterium]